jgi:hypothetical protein
MDAAGKGPCKVKNLRKMRLSAVLDCKGDWKCDIIVSSPICLPRTVVEISVARTGTHVPGYAGDCRPGALYEMKRAQ